MTKSNLIQIRVDDELKKLLTEAAERAGISVSDFIRQAAKDKASGISNVMTDTTNKPKNVITKDKTVITKPTNTDSGFERFKRFKNQGASLQDYRQLRPWHSH